ncbi:hypothetical protein F8388_001870 [Cannabis sativa]|uniref:Uncharacterized protein n=2 Tax=Cannabis sativa TaxID=3483 RepID=A0A7J6FFN4_CANSA|nr:hypothetical protein F8388_001870 [Cannabis sativa]
MMLTGSNHHDYTFIFIVCLLLCHMGLLPWPWSLLTKPFLCNIYIDTSHCAAIGHCSSYIYSGRRSGYTKAKGLEMSTAKKLLPVSLFYNANVAFALASLKGVNIPMYIAIKGLTPLAVLIDGFFSGKGRPTTQVCYDA